MKQLKNPWFLAITVLLLMPMIFSAFIPPVLIFGTPALLLFWYTDAILLSLTIFFWSQDLK